MHGFYKLSSELASWLFLMSWEMHTVLVPRILPRQTFSESYEGLVKMKSVNITNFMLKKTLVLVEKVGCICEVIHSIFPRK